MQAQKDYDKLKEKIDELASVINEAEDGVFADFCESIGVENIREYEERQLKVATAESEARLQYEKQIARLSHQCVFHCSYYALALLICIHLSRSRFIEEQLQTTEQRVQTINDMITTEEANIARYHESQETIQNEIREAEEAITELQDELKELTEDLEEKTKVVEQVKRTTLKSSKALDQALKEIATRVSAYTNAAFLRPHCWSSE